MVYAHKHGWMTVTVSINPSSGLAELNFTTITAGRLAVYLLYIPRFPPLHIVAMTTPEKQTSYPR
jgi:hypothetical protein